MLQVFQKLPALRHGPRQVLLLAPDIDLQPIRRHKAPTRNVEVARLRDVGIELYRRIKVRDHSSGKPGIGHPI